MVTLCGLVTVSTGIMGHLDFDLAGQIDIHIRQTLLFLGTAAFVALLVPSYSHARYIVQTTAISFYCAHSSTSGNGHRKNEFSAYTRSFSC